MNDDEEFLFQQEMAGVAPLQHEARVLPKRGPTATSAAARREAAVAETGDPNFLKDDDLPKLDPWYVLSFKRPGVQNGVFRKLKQGRYAAEARLNLHRRSVAASRKELYEFVMQAQELGLRSVQIVHGKGQNSREQEQASIIKGCVNHWLQQFEQVLAFHSATVQQGGTGAVFVLLRKSEEQKQKNRDHYTRGGST
jgi:DNA-nicking Smr family endonuclease